MTDYRPLLMRAIERLDPNTGEGRRDIYDRARQALVNGLRGKNPPLSEADITRERLALEDAIRRVEGEATAAPAAAAPRGEPPRTAVPPRAPAPQSRPDNSPRAAPHPAYEESEDLDSGEQPADPRAPRMGPRPDPRDPQSQRPEPSLRPRGVRRSPADVAREDARKASRTKFVVLGIVLVLLLLASAIGYVHRDRILSLVSGNLSVTQPEEDAPAPQANKANDRIQQQQNQVTPQGPAPQANQQVAGGQRAVLYEENPGTQQFTAVNGTVSWRTETISPGPGRSPELAVRAEVDIPDRKMKVVFSMRRNPEASGSASHYVEVQFVGSENFGGIAQVPAIRLKNNEAAQGFALAGISIRIVQGLFLIGLSNVETDRDRNLQALRTQPWIDIPFIYDNGRRSVIAFEKGPAGEKAMAEVFSAWGG